MPNQLAQHDLIGSECQYGHKHSYQLSSKVINAKPIGTIFLALNVNTDTSVAIKQALNQSIPNL